MITHPFFYNLFVFFLFILLGQSSTAIKHVTDAKKMEDAPHEKGTIGSNLDFQIHWYNFNTAT